ncbi:uncharacterized protein AMSG_02228 [Thecamonas trahens ATCC 50062]|uniref:Ras-GAP domain-containing protein n=1 Tax=Thecamonas trahens ATCC 50062 TaxID=461836 RepID=A0A0L0DVC6_THETB|nr:hypothetical protein AMSG_02228 [Thecamonas trahens ATCC 50062]KNC56259.1 hypothetical protein AMSG_02228 [Thecamonas trahens ATCC 50062]|eukprot:XP_013760781.1 hypothetical protein AMSG_02228 [Thecamonas trahens ATCC 50062]
MYGGADGLAGLWAALYGGAGEDGRVMVEDSSSNGTFVKLTKIGKGNKTELEDGEALTVVPKQKGHELIEWSFSVMSLEELAEANREPTPAENFEAFLAGPEVWPALDALANACSRHEAEKVAHALVTIFDSHGLSLDLLKWAITREVSSTERVSELFRGISVETKIVSDYAKRCGEGYITGTLQPTVLQLLSQGLSLEVDETKLAKGESIEANLQMLNLYCNIVVQMIFESLDNVPASFPQLFQFMKAAVLERWPDEEHIAVGGFVFLRFFCPALVSPHVYGIVTAPLGPREQRSLMLVAKVLQNLANGRHFGKKEPYMIPVNPFIDENLDRAQAFFNAIATPKADLADATSVPPLIEVTKGGKLRAILALARAFDAVRDRMLPTADDDEDVGAANLPPSVVRIAGVTHAVVYNLVNELLAAHAAEAIVAETEFESVESGARAVKLSAMQELLSRGLGARTDGPKPGGSLVMPSARPPKLGAAEAAAAARKRRAKSEKDPKRKSSRGRVSSASSSREATGGTSSGPSMPVEHVVAAVDLNLKPVDFDSLFALLPPDDPALKLIQEQYHHLIRQNQQLQDQLRRIGKEKRRWHHEAIKLRRVAGLTSQPEPMDAKTEFETAPFQLFML